MIKSFPPSNWQIFIDEDNDIAKFEDLINGKAPYDQLAFRGQFKYYDKMDDVVDGKLGIRYTFYPLTQLTQSEVDRLIKSFLEAAE